MSRTRCRTEVEDPEAHSDVGRARGPLTSQTSSNDDMPTTPDEVMEEVMEPERYVTIHVLEDGFTVLGEVLSRGFELTTRS